MTQKSLLENHDLAQVLSRINQLVKTSEANGQPELDAGEDIPVLTEVYEEKSSLAFVNLSDNPAYSELNQAVTDVMTSSQPVPAELADRFLAEVRPLILKAVKVAVLDESVKAEKLLTAKLEQEILRLLRNRLTGA